MTSKADKYIKKSSPIAKELYTLLPQNDRLTIFDIGSCEGLDSIRYSRMFPNAKVYSFEPISENFAKIKENLEKYQSKNITPYNLALSDKKGETSIYKSSGAPKGASPDWNYGNKASSLLPPKEVLDIYDWCNFDEKEAVKTETLSNFCTDNGIDTIDLIHLDVQGAELMVLNGAEKFIDKIFLVWMEVAYMELYDNQPLHKENIKFMEDRGFTLMVEDNRNVSGDHLYVNKAMLKALKGDDFLRSIEFNRQLKGLSPGELVKKAKRGLRKLLRK